MASSSFNRAQAGDSDAHHYDPTKVKKEEQYEIIDVQAGDSDAHHYDPTKVKKEEPVDTSDVQAGDSDAHHYDPMMVKKEEEEEEEEEDETSDSEEEEEEEEEVVVNVATRRRWNQVEDTLLLSHVAVHGPKMWRIISEQLQDRSSNACRVRWVNYLSPAPFASVEDLEFVTGKKQREKRVRSSTSTATATATVSLPAVIIFTGSDVVSPVRSFAFPRTFSFGSGSARSRRTPFKCVACTLGINSEVYGEGRAECGICRRVAELDRRRVNGGNVRESAPVNVNLTLATADYGPQASSPPPPPPPPSPSSPNGTIKFF